MTTTTPHDHPSAESDRAARALVEKYPLLHGKLIPWYHRRKGLVTTQLELTAA